MRGREVQGRAGRHGQANILSASSNATVHTARCIQSDIQGMVACNTWSGSQIVNNELNIMSHG